MDYLAWRGIHTPTYPVPDDSLYIPVDTHTVQSTPSMDHGRWASPSTLHPEFMVFPLSPPIVPAPFNSTPPHMVHDGPSTSTNYVWVPQRQYALTAHHFAPAPPIVFNVDSGEPGIRLSAALSRKFSQLKDRDDLVFESNKSPTITMRLEVCRLSELASTLSDGA